MIKIVHVINWLNFGGAEVTLCTLLERADRSRFDPVVVSLIDTLPLARRIEALGVPVHSLGMHPGVPDPRGPVRLARLLARERPDLVQTWMYHSNLIGSLAALASTRAPVVWNIRHTTHDIRTTKATTLLTVAANAALSRLLPAGIVCCAQSSQEVHARLGFARGRMVVIPNGFDTQAFRPDPAAGASLRAELGLPPDALLIGVGARFDPQKDHRTLLEAAARLTGPASAAHLVLCGPGIDGSCGPLAAWAEELSLSDRVHLLGPRQDMPRVLAGVDVVCSSSSYGEAFPRILCEAMASGVPCVATDVGDSAVIVGTTGRVVPPRDPAALAVALSEILGWSPRDREAAGRAARTRIAENYELAAVVARYEDLYERLHASRHGAGAADPFTGRPTARRAGRSISAEPRA